jgi:hypothetical protein
MLLEHEVGNIPPSSSVVKNGRSHTSIPIASLHVLRRDNITRTCVQEIKFCDGALLLDMTDWWIVGGSRGMFGYIFANIEWKNWRRPGKDFEHLISDIYDFPLYMRQEIN